MKCACHDAPAYWQKDKRRSAGGHWRCAVKKREANRRCHAGHAAARNDKEAERYQGSGWAKKRRRDLAAARLRVLEQLDQLAQEAEAC